MPDKLATAVLANMALVITPEPMDVAFPIEVTGPVKFALVVTVAALPVVFWLSIGKSPATAMDGTPVTVVFFRMPVASPANDVLFIAVTVEVAVTLAVPSKLGEVYVTSPVILIVLPVCREVAVPAFPVIVV